MFQRFVWKIKNNINNKKSKIRFGHFAQASIKIVNSVIGGEKLTFGATWNLADYRESCLSVSKSGQIIIHDNFYIYSGARISINGCLELGSGYINNDCSIFCANHIYIGKDVAIGSNVCIRDTDSHEILYDNTQMPDNYKNEIIIGNHVWIGERCTILKGVSIGEGSIIGAGAVVTKDIPASSMAVGVPARVIKTNVSWQ